MDWTEQEVGKMKGFVKSNPKLNPGLQNMNSNLRDMQVKIPPRPPSRPPLLNIKANGPGDQTRRMGDLTRLH